MISQQRLAGDVAMTDEQTEQRRRFRLQFSLATLLLLVTVACMAVALWVTARELWTLRAENQQYRNESGYLTISDPKRLHVIQIPTTRRRHVAMASVCSG